LTPDGGQPASPNGGDVLASLPHHRPGRRTSRRETASASKPVASGASRKSGRTAKKARPAGNSSRATRSASARAAGSSRRTSAATRPTGIPEQGFELEEEVRIGRAVEPPSRVEFATSLIELAGEGVEGFVRTSVSAGGSLLKRTLELIPKP